MTSAAHSVQAPAPKRKPSASGRRAWSKAVEQSSLAAQDALLREAIGNYGSLADSPVRMQLAREIAQARGRELTLAYRNVVMVMAGFKRSTVENASMLTREPCVIFIVRRKWKQGAADRSDLQFIPAHLVAHVTAPDGRRVPVAVPTDVQLEAGYAASRPQSGRAICVLHPGVPPGAGTTGTLAALVHVSGQGGGIRALTALHVLTAPYGPGRPGPDGGARIEVAQGKPQQAGAAAVGIALAEGGRLAAWPEKSFDAQLVDVTGHLDTVTAMLQGMPLAPEEPHIASVERYDELTAGANAPSMEILRPGNNPAAKGPRPRHFVMAAATSHDAGVLSYTDTSGNPMNVQHEELVHVESLSDETTVKGDSGSPVVIWLDPSRCTFAGMHIAGDGKISHVLPAWKLLEARNYGGTLAPDNRLSLMRQAPVAGPAVQPEAQPPERPAEEPFMAFSGYASPMSQERLLEVAEQLGVDLPVIWAVLFVETKGCGFLPTRQPKILFERHKFHKYTEGKYTAVVPDLSQPTAGGSADYGPAGIYQYERLRRAMALDETAALRSASWGLPQIMGNNWQAAGFDEVHSMITAFVDSEDKQLQAMANFIEHNGLAAALQNRDWAEFARRYNGEAYYKKGYDVKLANAHAKYSVGSMPDIQIRTAQIALMFSGIPLKGGVDGVFGGGTQDSLLAFQARESLPLTAIPDDATMQALMHSAGWAGAGG